MSEKVYPEGVRAFSPNAKAPDFVKAELVITPNQLVKWLKENPDLLTEYNGEKQLKLTLKSGTKGLYCEVNTYKKQEASSDLPF